MCGEIFKSQEIRHHHHATGKTRKATHKARAQADDRVPNATRFKLRFRSKQHTLQTHDGDRCTETQLQNGFTHPARRPRRKGRTQHRARRDAGRSGRRHRAVAKRSKRIEERDRRHRHETCGNCLTCGERHHQRQQRHDHNAAAKTEQGLREAKQKSDREQTCNRHRIRDQLHRTITPK